MPTGRVTVDGRDAKGTFQSSVVSLFSPSTLFSHAYFYIFISGLGWLSLLLTPMSKRMHILSTPTYPLPDLPFSPGISLAQQLAQLDQPAPVGQLNCCAKFFLINLIFCARGQILTRKI